MSVRFNGNGGYKITGANQFPDTPSAASPTFTITFWIYWPTVSTSGWNNLMWFDASTDHWLELNSVTTGKIGITGQMEAAQAISSATWYRVALVYSGGSTSLYVSPATATTVGTPGTNASVDFASLTQINIGGSDPAATSEACTGRVTNFKMWEGVALTTAQLHEELNNYRVMNPAGLLRHHKWNQTSGTPSVVPDGGAGATNLVPATGATLTSEANPPQILDAVAPTVSAGADATIDQYATFTRAATVTADGGAPVTAWAWTVVSGPNQVGATIGTGQTLDWAPTVGGTYVLGVTGTNSAGTSARDDVTVTVNALVFPVTAPLRLLGSAAGTAKDASAATTAPLRLTGSQTGGKVASASPTAALRLAASAEGMKINLVVAVLRLSAALTNAGSSNQAFVTAALKLGAAATNTGRATTVGALPADPLVLAASAEGASSRSGAVSGALRLAGGTSTGSKNVAGSRTAPVRLAATISNCVHATSVARTAPLRLTGSVSDRSTVRTGYPVTAPLRLQGSPANRSSTHSGYPVTAPLRLFAQAATQRVEAEILAIRPRADTTVKYEVVAVARVPQVSGPPMFLEVDPIDWTGITLSEALNTTPGLSVDVKIEKLPESVILRLNNPDEMPTELWVNRNGKLVFAGPLLTGRVSTEQITLEAQGIETYLRWMYVLADMSFTDVDQFAIAKALIDQWQAQEYGHFGIDTSAVGTSGVLRTITYPYTEQHLVSDRIADLAKLFDYAIDPASRALQLFSPARGIDRSVGEDAVVFDDRNVTNADIAFSIAPGDLASDGFGTATGSGSDQTLVSTFTNPELRAKFGRTGVLASFNAADQGALDAGVQGLVMARSNVLLIPGPNARVTLDADLSSYGVGDTISYQAHSRLASTGAWRIRKRTTRVSGTGTESVSLEFT